MRFTLTALAVLVSLAVATTAAVSASLDEFKAAFAQAEAASKQALAMKNGWTTTDSELKAAQKAADAGNFGEAMALARNAEALAKASIAQAKDEQTAWTRMVIH